MKNNWILVGGRSKKNSIYWQSLDIDSIAISASLFDNSTGLGEICLLLAKERSVEGPFSVPINFLLLATRQKQISKAFALSSFRINDPIIIICHKNNLEQISELVDKEYLLQKKPSKKQIISWLSSRWSF